MLKAVLVYVIAPPLLLLGYLVNAPVWYLLRVFTRRLATLNKDAATLKLLGGLVLYPLAWLAVAMLVGFGVLKAETLYPSLPADPMAAGVTVFFLCGLGGALVLFYSQMLRETWHALRTRLTLRRRWLTVDHLKHERASLHDDIVELARGADLPGKLLPDGRVLPT